MTLGCLDSVTTATLTEDAAIVDKTGQSRRTQPTPL
jgi:hypothetical protein